MVTAFPRASVALLGESCCNNQDFAKLPGTNQDEKKRPSRKQHVRKKQQPLPNVGHPWGFTTWTSAQCDNSVTLRPKQIQRRCWCWFVGLPLVSTRFSSKKLPWAPNNCQPFILHHNIQPLIEASCGRLQSLHTRNKHYQVFLCLVSMMRASYDNHFPRNFQETYGDEEMDFEWPALIPDLLRAPV